jgi:hypothetical protein
MRNYVIVLSLGSIKKTSPQDTVKLQGRLCAAGCLSLADTSKDPAVFAPPRAHQPITCQISRQVFRTLSAPIQASDVN